MKSTIALCSLSAALGVAAGAWGGMAYDKRAGDLSGANMQMNEVATQLKLMAGLLFQLKQSDAAEVQSQVRQSISRSKETIEKGRTNPALTPATRMRMDEAVNLAGKAESTAP